MQRLLPERGAQARRVERDDDIVICGRSLKYWIHTRRNSGVVILVDRLGNREQELSGKFI